MADRVGELADVLRSLRRSRSGTAEEACEKLESLQLVVQEMTTRMAVHEVQLAKLREAVLMLLAERDAT